MASAIIDLDTGRWEWGRKKERPKNKMEKENGRIRR